MLRDTSTHGGNPAGSFWHTHVPAFGDVFLQRDLPGDPAVHVDTGDSQVTPLSMKIPAQVTVPATSKKRAPLVSLFVANALSTTGNIMGLIAIPWFVLETTGSAAKAGLSGFFTFLPVALAGFFGGVLVDRMGFRRTSIVADLASGVAVALIPLLHWTGGLSYPRLLILVFLGALLDAPGQTARASLIPEVAKLAGTSIERATSLSDAVYRFSSFAGAPLAGVLIATVGSSNVLWIDAGTFAVSAAIIAVAVPARTSIPTQEVHTGYLVALMEGWGFLRREAVLLAVVLTLTVTNFLDAAYGSVILPVYARSILGSAIDLGLILGTFGAGALLGAVGYGSFAQRVSRRHLLVWGLALAGARFFVLVPFPPVWILIVSAFLTGLGAGPLNPVMDVVTYERVPLAMRGRVLGMTVATAWMAMPLGVLSAGFALEWLGMRVTLIISGVAYLAAALSLLAFGELKRIDDHRPLGS